MVIRTLLAVSGLLVALLPQGARAQRREPLRGRAGNWLVEVWTDADQGTFSFWLQFTRGADVMLLPPAPFQHGEQNLDPPAFDEQAHMGFEAWMRAELDAYLRSPTSFRDHALLRLEQLRHSVEQMVRRGELHVRVPRADGRSCLEFRHTGQGEGGFNVCASRALTAHENAVLLAALHVEIDGRERLVRQNYRAWYAAVRALVPRSS